MLNKTLLSLCIFLFYSCQNSQKIELAFEKSEIYTNVDTVTLYRQKFPKADFNTIIDEFPRLYQLQVLHPDTLYALDKNMHVKANTTWVNTFEGEIGKDRYFALYTHFLIKRNEGKRNEYIRKHLLESYFTIHAIFEKLNDSAKVFKIKPNHIPAYAEFDMYDLTSHTRIPEFTKKPEPSDMSFWKT